MSTLNPRSNASKLDLPTLIRFISVRIGVPEAAISPESALLHDVGVDGDDAEELFADLRKEFGLQVDERRWGDYFNGEACAAHWQAMLTWSKEPILRKEKLTVARLLDAIHDGRLW